MAARSAGGSRTIVNPESYGTFNHLWPSVAHESASAAPSASGARVGEASAQSPKAPSTCTQAPAAWARSLSSRSGSKAPVLMFPACRHTMAFGGILGNASARMRP